MVDCVKEELEEEMVDCDIQEDENDLVDCVMEPETLLQEQEEGEEWGAEIRLRPTTTLLSPRPFPTSPPTTTSLPSTEDWAGPHQLRIEVTTVSTPTRAQVEEAGNSKKRGYAFSSVLNKLYIDMDKQVGQVRS